MSADAADDPSPPTGDPVKLVFIHHSTGGNWLGDPHPNPNWDDYAGGLAFALMDNNYYVNATNYSWGPVDIGNFTDIGQWWYWFRDGLWGVTRDQVMDQCAARRRSRRRTLR